MRPCAQASSRLSNRQSSGMTEEELLDRDILLSSTSMTDTQSSSKRIECIRTIRQVSYVLPLTGGIPGPKRPLAFRRLEKESQKQHIHSEEASTVEDMA